MYKDTISRALEKDLLLYELEKLRDSSKLIIVEGKKDKAALEHFGISDARVLKGSIYAFCEELSKTNSEVVILTDLDKEGKKLYSMLKENLVRNGIKIDDSFRNFLLRETKIRQIEGLVSYTSNLE